MLKFLAVFALGGLCACQSPRPAQVAPEHPVPSVTRKNSADALTRNNALALLDELLNEEKHLSKILLIKRESDELNRLVKDISQSAAQGAKRLETLMKEDPSLHLPGNGLPPGEKATRAAIAKTKQHALLHSSGAEFEFQLLLTQTQALGYGAHLAQVAADNDLLPGRAREFSRLSAELEQLYEQVLARLRIKAQP